MYKKFLYAVGHAEKRFSHLCFSLLGLFLFSLIVVICNTGAEAAGPLRVSSTNPRYFTDENGKAVYLAGSYLNEYNLLSGSWDFVSYLDYLQQQNHNFTRVWGWEQSPWSLDSARQFSFTVQPYERTGPGLASDGDLKFDLSGFNQSYFDQLRSRVVAAGERGIYVSVMLFEGFSNQKKVGQVNPWLGDPFQAANNINGIDGDPNHNGGGEEFFSLTIPAIVSLQEAFVRKVVDTLNDLDNVLYEISGDGLSNSLEWQYHMVDYLKAYQAGKPNQHLVGMSQFYSSSLNEALGSAADWIVSQVSNLNPGMANQNKPLFLEAAPALFKSNSSYQWIWKSFSRGYNVTYLEPTVPNATINDALHVAIGQTVAYSQFVDFTPLAPNSKLCSTGYCLTDPGKEYLVYLPSGGRVTLDLSASKESFLPTWFAPAEGTTVSGSPVSGGTKVSLKPPFRGEAVLELQKQLPQQTSIDTSSGISSEQTAITKASSSATSNTVATPTITPNGGIYSGTVSVTLQTSTSKAVIYYTTDGQSPTQSSQRYTKPFVLSASTLVKARAFKNNLAPSAEASAWFSNAAASNFNFTLASSGNMPIIPGLSASNTITATLSSGSAQGVSFSVAGLPSSATASLSSPSCSPTCSTILTISASGATPAGSFPITVTAVGGGLTRTTSFTLTVSAPAAAAPTLSPNGGSYFGSVSVSMQTATSGAAIYYSTDGSVPTQSSTLYAGPFTLTSSAIVKAKAFKSGYTGSNETSASFTVAAALSATVLGQTGQDIAGTFSEGADGVGDVQMRLTGVQSPLSRVRITDSGVGIWETPSNGQNWIVAIRPQSDASKVDLYFDYWQPTASYTLNLTFANGSSRTIQVAAPFDFAPVGSGDQSVVPGSSVTNLITTTLVSGTSQAVSFSVSGLPSGASGSFSSASCSPTCSTVLNITTSASTPTGNFPITISATGGGVTKTTAFKLGVTLALTVATPLITPNGASFTDSLSVTITSATSGASIYYTTDGSTPTQSSMFYAGALNLTGSTNLNAKAFKTGYTDSTIANASFTQTGSRSGATYYVGKNGSNSNSCAQARSASTPKLTIQAGLTCLGSGDTLIIKAGTYIESINNGTQQIPSGGGSWSAATLIQGASGEKVILRPAAGARSDPTTGQENVLAVYGRNWIIFDNLVVDASNVSIMGIRLGAGAHHVRMTNSEIMNAQNNCVYIDDGTVNSFELLNSKVHDCGRDLSIIPAAHAVYLHGSDHVIDGNEIYNTNSKADSHGIHVYDNTGGPTNNIVVRNNLIHNNGARGILIGSGRNHQAYRNIVYSNGAGIAVGYGATAVNNQVYDNAIYSNSGYYGGYCVEIRSGSYDSIVQNNRCWQNGADTIGDFGTGSILSNNSVLPPP